MKTLLLTLGMLLVLSGCKNSTGPSSAPAQSTSRSVYDSICMVEAWDVVIDETKIVTS